MHVGRGALTLATPPVHARGVAANTHHRAPTAAYRHASQGRAQAVATRTQELPFLESMVTSEPGTAPGRDPYVFASAWNKVLRWPSKAGPDPPYNG